MTYANPYYDPEWEVVHDRHEAERTRVGAELDSLARAGAVGSDTYQQAEAEFDRHHQACLASFKMQYPTVQEYAAWLFRQFDVSMSDWEGGTPVPMVDLATLRTIEEADQAWSRVHRIVSSSAAERRLSLPTGQPNGLRAFADAASPTLSRYWREFLARELYPVGYTGGAGIRTLVTVDEQDDGWHVCFMHDWDSVGVSVTNAIARLATAIHREACALAEQQGTTLGGVRAWLERRRAMRARAVMLAPDRFYFYQHVPPRGETSLRERFDRVDMRFEAGEFRQPEWFGYDIIPATVQSARFDCALDTSALNTRPERSLTYEQHTPGNHPTPAP